MKLSNKDKSLIVMSVLTAVLFAVFMPMETNAFANDQKLADSHRAQQERQANRARIVADRTRLMDQKHLAPQAGHSVFAEYTPYQQTLNEYFSHPDSTGGFASMVNHGFIGRVHFSSKRSDAYVEQGPLWGALPDDLKQVASVFTHNLNKVTKLGNKDPQRGGDLVSHKDNPLLAVILNYIHNSAEGEERGVQIIHQQGMIYIYKKDQTGLHLFKGRSLEEAIQVAFQDELLELTLAASMVENQIEGSVSAPAGNDCNGAMPVVNAIENPFEYFGDIDNKHVRR